MPDPFVQRLRSGGPTLFGTWVKISAIEVVEMLAYAGFDYIVLDMEHAPLTLEAVYRATVVAQGLGLGVLARVPDTSAGLVQRLLDAGLDGLLVPRVSGAQMAETVVRSMIFEPNGRRGMGVTSRAGKWGLGDRDAYVGHGNTGVVRAIQIEDRGALESIEAIAAIPDLSAVFIGTADLSLSSGLAATHPELEALIERVLKACRARGLPCGTAVGTADAARKARERGFDFVMVSNDATLFAQAARALVAGIGA